MKKFLIGAGAAADPGSLQQCIRLDGRLEDVAAAYFLAPAIQSALRLQRDDPTGFARFGDGQVLFYAFAAYNAGFGAVLARYNAGENPDGGTTDGYAARAIAAYSDFVAGSHRALVGL